MLVLMMVPVVEGEVELHGPEPESLVPPHELPLQELSPVLGDAPSNGLESGELTPL